VPLSGNIFETACKKSSNFLTKKVYSSVLLYREYAVKFPKNSLFLQTIRKIFNAIVEKFVSHFTINKSEKCIQNADMFSQFSSHKYLLPKCKNKRSLKKLENFPIIALTFV
jgi:hypothetical protein